MVLLRIVPMWKSIRITLALSDLLAVAPALVSRGVHLRFSPIVIRQRVLTGKCGMALRELLRAWYNAARVCLCDHSEDYNRSIRL